MPVLLPEDTRANLISMAHAGGLYGIPRGGGIAPVPVGGGFWGDVWDGLKGAGKWTYNNIIKPIGEPVLQAATHELGSAAASTLGGLAGGGGLSTRKLSESNALPSRSLNRFITPS